MAEALDPKHIGRKLPPFKYTVEPGKVREFAIAIGDDNPAYFADDPADMILPPTFPTTFAFWSVPGMLFGELEKIGVDLLYILHGEQEFDFLGTIRPGDTVHADGYFKDIFTKKGRGFEMDFVVVEFTYTNQHDEPVLIERVTIIYQRPV